MHAASSRAEVRRRDPTTLRHPLYRARPPKSSRGRELPSAPPPPPPPANPIHAHMPGAAALRHLTPPAPPNPITLDGVVDLATPLPLTRRLPAITPPAIPSDAVRDERDTMSLVPAALPVTPPEMRPAPRRLPGAVLVTGYLLALSAGTLWLAHDQGSIASFAAPDGTTAAAAARAYAHGEPRTEPSPQPATTPAPETSEAEEPPRDALRASPIPSLGPFNRVAAADAIAAAVEEAHACPPVRSAGNVGARVSFGPSGEAVAVVFTPDWVAATNAGQCIAQPLRQMSVPAFSGEPVTVYVRVQHRSSTEKKPRAEEEGEPYESW